MLKLEAEVHDFTQRTCDKMLRTEGRFDVKEAYNCYTADIISQYAFGEPMGFIDQEGWEPNFGSWVYVSALQTTLFPSLTMSWAP